MNCVLDNGVRTLSRAGGQKIRGLKHRQHRPSLIIADDAEDLDWVRTQENRDKSDRWMRGNVLSSIDEATPMHPFKKKRARLHVAARHIKKWEVKFSRKGCEQRPAELVGCGMKKHDDGVDALANLILGVARASERITARWSSAMLVPTSRTGQEPTSIMLPRSSPAYEIPH